MWSGDHVEDYKTHNCLECHQDVDHAQILNIQWSVSGIIHTLIGVDVCWKDQIKPVFYSDPTDGEI